VQGSIGNAYRSGEFRDLDSAEQAYQASLDLLPEHDTLTRVRVRVRVYSSLGAIDLARFDAARRDAGADPDELLQHLNHALTAYHGALQLLPDGHPDRAITHHLISEPRGGQYTGSSGAAPGSGLGAEGAVPMPPLPTSIVLPPRPSP
jgi:hypothetical protein